MAAVVSLLLLVVPCSAQTPPGFSKAFGPAVIGLDASNIGVHDTSTLVFTIDNTANGVAVGNLFFGDSLPSGVVVADPANASTTCSGGTVQANAGGNSIFYQSGGSVPAASTCTVTADVTSDTAGSYLNTSGELTSDAGSSGTAQAILAVVEWTTTPRAPLARRWYHTASLVPSGEVALVGGKSGSGSTVPDVEVFDLSGGWSSIGSLTFARMKHTTTLLQSGELLVAGGGTEQDPLDPDCIMNPTLDSCSFLETASAELFDPQTGVSSPTGSLALARQEHTATLLPSGEVLVVGGVSPADPATPGVELYDPDPGVAQWSPGSPLGTGRKSHTATLLPSGLVLVAGGEDSSGGPLASVELYDPVNGTWSPTGPLGTARSLHTATLLPSSGQVLVAGGGGAAGSSAELFDPGTGTWSPAASLGTARSLHSATLLPSEKLLVAGGLDAGGLTTGSAELYDPVADSWTPVGFLAESRLGATATLLPSGQVLVTLGKRADGFGQAPGSAEIFQPPLGTSTWSAVQSLRTERQDHTAVNLPSGRILVAGGSRAGEASMTRVELYDPVQDVWHSSDDTDPSLCDVGDPPHPDSPCPMLNGRASFTATLLGTGEVLVVGGAVPEVYDPVTGIWRATSNPGPGSFADQTATLLPSGLVLVAGASPASSAAWLYDPDAVAPMPEWTQACDMVFPRGSGATATLLPSGKVLLAGGAGSGTTEQPTAELYDPGAENCTESWTATGFMTNSRSGHSATLLASGQVLVVGGGPTGKTAELYDPVTGAWSATGSTANGHFSFRTTLLPSGQVLVASEEQPELYDPAAGAWRSAGLMEQPRTFAAFALLRAGGVLLIGGRDNEVAAAVDTVDLFKPGSQAASRRPSIAPLTAPSCLVVAPECDSGTRLDGRDSIALGPESHQPNTIDDCGDGTTGTYHVDESVDHVRVFTAGGTPLTAGAMATIEVDIWAHAAFFADDRLDLFYAADADNPVWTLLETQIPPAGGAQSLSASYTLPAGDLQAIRARLRYAPNSPTAIPCGTVNFEDHDDLVFAVADATSSPHTLRYGEPFQIRGKGFSGDSEASSGGTNSSSVNYPLIRLQSLHQDRLAWLTWDDLSDLCQGSPSGDFGFCKDAEAMLSVSELPPILDPGWHFLTVYASGVPSESKAVYLECSLSLTQEPTDQSVDPGATASFGVETEGGRNFQWERCVPQLSIEDCAEASSGWVPIPGATSATYTTPPVVGTDTGARYRVRVDTGCTEQLSQPATLVVTDTTLPGSAPGTAVRVDTPNGGDLWVLSEPCPVGDPDCLLPENQGLPNDQFVAWTALDDVRVCEVRVSLVASADGGEPYLEVANGQLYHGDLGVGCAAPGWQESNFDYRVPSEYPVPVGEVPTAGWFYKIRLEVWDHAGNPTAIPPGDPVTDESDNPFFILQASDADFKTLVLWNCERMEALGLGGDCDPTVPSDGLDRLETALDDLAEFLEEEFTAGLGRAFRFDLGDVGELTCLYQRWDACTPGTCSQRANELLLGDASCAPAPDDTAFPGIQGKVRKLRGLFPSLEYLIVVGDDRVIPFARFDDGTADLTEQCYPNADGSPLGCPAPPEAPPVDLDTSTTVGRALDENRYLSDDPLTLDLVLQPGDLISQVGKLYEFKRDLSVGRLVETPDQITGSVATFIGQNGFLDLSSVPSNHQVLVTGYDFLIDSAQRIADSWGATQGMSCQAPADSELLSSNWGIPDAPADTSDTDARKAALESRLRGCAVPASADEAYGILSLNGHATHHEEGVPGESFNFIEGLSASAIADIDLTGRVVYAVGCHGGLPVPGECGAGGLNPCDLPEALSAAGVMAYVANTGYGWGLESGIGYSERLVEILTDKLRAGGSVGVGEAVRATKEEYALLTQDPSSYDFKSLLEWTYFGFPMYQVDTGIGGAAPLGASQSPPPRAAELAAAEEIDGVGVRRAVSGAGATGPRVLGPLTPPDYVTRLAINFDLSADGIYRKFDAAGNEIIPISDPCPPGGCYYRLNGLATSTTDLPIQPYLVFDSRLLNTSQHGVLWMGGQYQEEGGWTPLLAEVQSNGGDFSDHGPLPRHMKNKAVGRRRRGLGDLNAEVEPCDAVDVDLARLVLTTGDVLKSDSGNYDLERLDRRVDVELLYYNNTLDPSQAGGNCDRTGPYIFSPVGAGYAELNGTTVRWSVPVCDGPAADADEASATGSCVGGARDGVWRVVVVYSLGPDGQGDGDWVPLELEATQVPGSPDLWEGELSLAQAGNLTYVVQAVDKRGNVSWIDFVAPDCSLVPLPPECPFADSSPATGVEPDLPALTEVEINPDDLSLVILDSPDPAVGGNPLTYTLQVGNYTTETLTDVDLAQVLPGSTSFVSAAGTGWSCSESGGTVTCQRPSLAPGNAPTIAVTVFTPAAGLLLTSDATLDATGAGPTLFHAEDGEETTVTAPPTPPDVLDLYNVSFSDLEVVRACQEIRLALVWILAPADVTFEAGQQIIIEHGVMVEDGASFTAIIDPSLCPPP